MPDPRILNLARTLVRYCVGAQPREIIGVNAPTVAEPLVLAVYEDLLRAGAHPELRLTPAGAAESLMRLGHDHHFDTLTPLDRAYARALHGVISIRSSTNTRELSEADPARQARLARASKPIREMILRKKWTLTLFPTAAHAQDAEMSLREFEDYVYAATFSDEPDPVKAWKELKRMQDRLIAKLDGADEIRIVGRDTDLTLSVKGRTWINSPGTHNMPSGEVFTGPVETSANGHIRYDFPVCHGGREIDGIRLVFRNGKVVEASAEKNESFLHAMLDMDPGARRLGELGIGTNRRIQRFIKNILFDEKIGGTVHLALGQSYAETGGTNRSALHWDMIKDLRDEGAVYVDGKLFQKNGRFR